jgi:hypothetical protein
MGRVTPALLTKILSAFKDDEMMLLKHVHLVECAAAVIQTLSELHRSLLSQ